jgi:hypothetical protein
LKIIPWIYPKFVLNLLVLILLQWHLLSQCEAGTGFYTFGSVNEVNQFSTLFLKTPTTTYQQASELADAEDHFSVGYFYAYQNLNIDYFQRPNGIDIGADIYQGRIPKNGQLSPLKQTPLPTSAIKQRGSTQPISHDAFFQLATSSQLLKKGQHKISLGILLLIPIKTVENQTPRFSDERAQYFDNSLFFAKWGNYFDGLSSSFALSWKYGQILGLGVGTVMLNEAQAKSEVFLSDATYQGTSYTLPSVKVVNRFSPYFSASGILLNDLEKKYQLKWGANLYLPESSTVDGNGKVKIWGFQYEEGQNALTQSFSQHYRYLPYRLQFSLALQMEKMGFYSIIQRSFWSSRIDEQGENSGWTDQWEGTWGGYYQGKINLWDQGYATKIGLDLRWRPSPVKPQIGRRNDIDPSALAFALAYQLKIKDWLSIQISGQWHWLMSTSVKKNPYAQNPVQDEVPDTAVALDQSAINNRLGLQTNNPGFPGYRAGGTVLVLGLFANLYF